MFLSIVFQVVAKDILEALLNLSTCNVVPRVELFKNLGRDNNRPHISNCIYMTSISQGPLKPAEAKKILTTVYIAYRHTKAILDGQYSLSSHLVWNFVTAIPPN